MLFGPVLHVGGMPIQAGDKVMMLRNDRRLHVSNDAWWCRRVPTPAVACRSSWPFAT